MVAYIFVCPDRLVFQESRKQQMTSSLACSVDPLLQANYQYFPPSHRCKKHRRPFHRREDLRRLLNQSRNCQQLLQIHAHIIRCGLASGDHADTSLLYHLLRLYSSFSRLDLASRLFRLFPNPSTFAFNLMIRAQTAAGEPTRSLLLYNRMIFSGVSPDKFTFPFVVRSCTACFDAAKGKEVHAFAIKTGFWRDPFLLNALISLYFSCGDAADGLRVFEKMRVRSVVTWTALVSGLLACGDLAAARAAFDAMPERNVVSWTVMINGCARNGRPEEAFALFWKMLKENQKPNSYTMVGLLIACSELGSLSLVRWVHDFARKNGMLKRGFYIGTALIDIYSNCGSIGEALKVFDEMPVRSLATWNSLITSLGVHGRGKEALELFREMEKMDLMPDGITFVGVLCACVRSGMVEEGLKLYKIMKEDYKIESGVKHYECLVELLNSASIQGKPAELSSELSTSAQQMLVNACIACGENKAMDID
ncbi:Pentatricopeptide repeat-containing protein [Dendrobium catenatum]|uniref:Pentatricopeptide repeat-containing protein n=2 Tax=Dendrobium catenatum TaxID=906689 RepID=A0A2I0X9R0_9ASPA|nr:Pentatricopeptide repeat-containing protein [Dendrobium catenatum]